MYFVRKKRRRETSTSGRANVHSSSSGSTSWSSGAAEEPPEVRPSHDHDTPKREEERKRTEVVLPLSFFGSVLGGLRQRGRERHVEDVAGRRDGPRVDLLQQRSVHRKVACVYVRSRSVWARRRKREGTGGLARPLVLSSMELSFCTSWEKNPKQGTKERRQKQTGRDVTGESRR
jgi:hypothetical protein